MHAARAHSRACRGATERISPRVLRKRSDADASGVFDADDAQAVEGQARLRERV